ncbi:glutathione S-transferase 1-like [Uloborus diversus]|uniref:glutathione S-transferase 1-like n=1 Tax=Uloborus diversus TaxID=327109 RepID=UPI0024099CFD|nr:glutathione S-transferase 1-like [Uloborus diversus]
MPQYRLVDYSYPTTGEVARLLLQFRDVEYEDHKVESPDEIYEAEEEAPFGTLPVLYVDGKAVAQGQGISRYLARELGLVGETNEEAATCDMIMDGLGVMFAKMRGLDLSQKDVGEQVALLKQMMREDVPRHLHKYERFLEKSNLSSGYFASEKLTWCDLGVTLCLAGMQLRQPSLLEKHPRLRALVQKVTKEPVVEHFVDTELAQSAIIRKNSM